MRTHGEWLALLERQASDVDEASEILIDARDRDESVEKPLATFRKATQLYKAMLNECPLDVLATFAAQGVRARQSGI